MSTPNNLDQKAACYAQKIVEQGGAEIDNPVTKSLGVLQEQGVYACVLYLLANKYRTVLLPLYDLLKELPAFHSSPDLPKDAKDVLKFYSDNVCNDLDRLLLVKDLYEQTLIYARYGAKAAKAKGA